MILSRENLLLALKCLEANKEAAGVGGMKTEELWRYICKHPGELMSAILLGKYHPALVKRVNIETGKREVQTFWYADGRRPFCATSRCTKAF